ncbi:hypothetical protein [Brevibacillus nitrificans]|uniref:hypothetical protein n=1 Tax=Brevibacillus nitrificans TaxID=651560 RepID=UPI00262462F9|nr:hypothetical protein [Brevibacillus nitrificans]
MKLPFEKWLEEQKIAEDAVNLAHEAILCYKNGAYRAALLFSYLMFQTIIKERIIKSKKPERIDDPAWDAIRRNLNKDEDWDKYAFQAVQRKEEKSIFLISDDLRRQVEYWKDRRNDCAHFKKNLITYSHVESFWQFIQSNLPKFMVNGGKDALLEKIRIQFDTTYTRSGQDFSNLINEIHLVTEAHELDDFFKDTDKLFEKIHPFYPGNDDENLEDMIKFWVACLKAKELQDAVVNFLKLEENDSLFVQVLNQDPSLLGFFMHDQVFVRTFWQKRLRRYYNDNKYWDIVNSFLLHGAISTEERMNFFSINLPKHANTLPSTTTFNSLIAFGFDEFYKDFVFGGQKFRSRHYGFPFANQNSRFILFFVESIGLDVQIVEEFTYIFKSMDFGFVDDLRTFFEERPALVEQYKQICAESGLELPKVINEL